MKARFNGMVATTCANQWGLEKPGDVRVFEEVDDLVQNELL